MDNTPPSNIQVRSYRALNPTQLLRTQETRRITEVKIQNIERNIEQLRETKAMIEKRKSLRAQLDAEKARLQNLEKQLSTMAAERKQLERLEAFESISSTFLRLKIIQKLSAENNRNISELEREAELLRKQWDEQEKRQQQAHELSLQAEEQILTTRDLVLEGMKLEGSTEEAKKELEYLRQMLAHKKKEIEDVQSAISAHEEEMEMLKQDIERNHAGRASMEMHEQMLEQEDKVLIMLELLQDSKSTLDSLRAKQKEAVKNKDDENEQLGHIFSQFQDVMSEINTLEETLETHQQNMLGQDVHKAQERAMLLKARLQMLIQAKSLWRRISAGYTSIEEGEEAVGELRHTIGQEEQYMKHLEDNDAQSAIERLSLESNFRKGRLQAMEENLKAMKQSQAEAVSEWQMFAHLDKQFQDCSASTNRNTRSAMLEMLIDNTTRDEDTARKELEALNFHQEHIAEINERLQALAQERNDLTLRMGELNTGCQVMAGQVERLNRRIETEYSRYSEIYEELKNTITIKDWLAQWQQNPEALSGHIKQLSEAWKAVNERIAMQENDLQIEKAKAEHLRQLLELHTTDVEMITKRKEAIQSNIESYRNEHERLLADKSAPQLLNECYDQFISAYKSEEKESKASAQIKGTRDRVLGRNDFHLRTGEDLSKELAHERSVLDVWMHNYNLQHSPVQYQELEDLFEPGKDWNAVRANIRPLIAEESICRQKVEMLERKLLSMQTGNNALEADDEHALSSVEAQIESTIAQAKELNIQLARLTICLEEHEKAMQNSTY